MWLLIDDERNLNTEVVARTVEAARVILATNIPWECICFDHDLGSEMSGYDVLNWALSTNNLRTRKIQLVTSNPVGRQNMMNLLEDNGYTHTYGGVSFEKLD